MGKAMASVSGLIKGFQSNEKVYLSIVTIHNVKTHNKNNLNLLLPPWRLVVWLLAEVIYWNHSIPFLHLHTKLCKHMSQV